MQAEFNLDSFRMGMKVLFFPPETSYNQRKTVAKSFVAPFTSLHQFSSPLSFRQINTRLIMMFLSRTTASHRQLSKSSSISDSYLWLLLVKTNWNTSGHLELFFCRCMLFQLFPERMDKVVIVMLSYRVLRTARGHPWPPKPPGLGTWCSLIAPAKQS